MDAESCHKSRIKHTQNIEPCTEYGDGIGKQIISEHGCLAIKIIKNNNLDETITLFMMRSRI